MYPLERSLVKQFENRPFVIVGVNSDDSLETLRKAMKDNELTWTSFFDGGGTGGPIATRWSVTGWPTVYVLDPDGIIRYRDVRGTSLDQAIAKLMSEIPRIR